MRQIDKYSLRWKTLIRLLNADPKVACHARSENDQQQQNFSQSFQVSPRSPSKSDLTVPRIVLPTRTAPEQSTSLRCSRPDFASSPDTPSKSPPQPWRLPSPDPPASFSEHS